MKKKKYLILFLLFLLLFCISSYNIIKYIIDNRNTNKELNIINDNVVIKEKEVIIDEDEIQDIDPSDPYWDYIDTKLVDVDFNELKKINNDVKGWIIVEGTNINYPFVQTDNNEYYLTHSFDKSYNQAGWVFLDYRNDLSNFENKNTILYAHGRYDGTMFGTLKNIFSNGWLNNKSNYIVKLSTEYENTLWQVFSIYIIDTTSDYIVTEFNDNESYLKFLNMIKERSSFNFNTDIKETDRILTLSTCYNNEKKVVLHAKMIKNEKK